MYRVMIVDDEPAVCQGMARLIDWNHYSFEVVQLASNGAQALQLQLANQYDLIVTDLKMPVMDGVELIRQLNEHKQRCTVIIVSAYGEFSYAQTVMQYGVKYYLLKPVNECVIGGYLSKIAEELSLASPPETRIPDLHHFEHQYNLSTCGVITEICRYICDHFQEPLSLNHLAEIYSFSPAYLGKLFQKEMGISFNEYLNHYRIRAAMKYIERTALPFSEIAETVGYRSFNYFYKCFKSIAGMTPGEYRKQCMKQKSDSRRSGESGGD